MNHSCPETTKADRDPDECLVEAVVTLVPRIGQRLHASTAEHAQLWGLTVGQAKVLLKVGLNGPMPVGEIAQALGVSMPAASEIVDRLADAGFVRREHDSADRRRVLVGPSDAAERFAIGLKRQRCRQVRQALDGLEPEQRLGLVRGLEALLDAFAVPGDQIDDDAASEPRLPVVDHTDQR
jgi:DNA-binding MarR family transcriptional regulator